MKTLLVWSALLILPAVFAAVEPVNLRCEYLESPKGIDIQDARFYWKLQSVENNQQQSAYQVLVASKPELLEKNQGDLFDSGKVISSDSTQIVYEGKKLDSSTDYFWKVRVWDHEDESSESQVATFSTGLFSEKDWGGAEWIAKRPQAEWEKDWWARKAQEEKVAQFNNPNYFGHGMSIWERARYHYENPYDPAPLIRKSFTVSKPIARAEAFISGIGNYELHINGKRIGDHVLDPGWTDCRKTVLYVPYDVTKELLDGENAIGVMLGRGFYGMLTMDHWKLWKKGGWIGQPKLLFCMKITYEDGTTENVVSDLSWKITEGPVRYDGPHMGELYDANYEVKGWSEPKLNTADWASVVSAPSPGGELKAQLFQPMREVAVTKPVSVKQSRRGTWIDTGTNMSGWIRVRVNVKKGTNLLIYYGEESTPVNLMQPGGLQQMGYIAKGEKDEVMECRFSYKGFRYAFIKAYPGTLTVDDIDVVQVNSDVPEVGTFNCSNEVLNDLHKICVKSLVSNLHSIPTDCPHREKNGWLGDAVTGIEYGMANADMAALITKFTRDIFDTQDEKGNLSAIAPGQYRNGASPLWSSAAVHLPWYMYQYYGDTRLFEQYWEEMKSYTVAAFKYQEEKDRPGILKEGYGDWSSPHGNKSDDGSGTYGTLNMYLVFQRLEQMAQVLGKDHDVKYYRERAEYVREAYYKHGFDEEQGIFTGVDPSSYRQGPNAMALQYGLAKPDDFKSVMSVLVDDIATNHNTNFYGGIFTGHALWELMPKSGYADLTYDVAMNPAYPGFRYQLDRGATTVWEHWTDGSSHMHYFKGYVDNFLYRYVAGLNLDSQNPGFKEILFTPKLFHRLDHASATFESIHGMVSIDWKKDADSNVVIDCEVPVNCIAKFVVPPEVDGLSDANGTVLPVKTEHGETYVVLTSGKHQLKTKVVVSDRG